MVLSDNGMVYNGKTSDLKTTLAKGSLSIDDASPFEAILQHANSTEKINFTEEGDDLLVGETKLEVTPIITWKKTFCMLWARNLH
jgi:hypothetical protein